MTNTALNDVCSRVIIYVLYLFLWAALSFLMFVQKSDELSSGLWFSK